MSVRTVLGALIGRRADQRTVDVGAVRPLQDGGAVLLDVRSRQEYGAGHAPGATNVPVEEIDRRLRDIPSDRTVLTICQSGGRSARAAAVLRGRGLQEVRDVRGGMTAWQRAGLPVQRR
jgi:rhodanese-related sulfurtransferase